MTSITTTALFVKEPISHFVQIRKIVPLWESPRQLIASQAPATIPLAGYILEEGMPIECSGTPPILKGMKTLTLSLISPAWAILEVFR